jgi:DNA-binding response OmpR family regulator
LRLYFHRIAQTPGAVSVVPFTMTEWKVLLLSDDIEPLRLWAYGLAQRGVAAVLADFTKERPEQYLNEPPDIVIIDVYGANREALCLCRELRAQLVNPILMLAYITTEPEMVEAYDAGVDECIAKPIGLRLLVVKVRAWLRRAWTVPTEALTVLEMGGLCLSPDKRLVTLPDGVEIALTNLELRLLHLLMSHPGQVLEPSLMIDRVWGYESAEGAVLKNMIYRLRRKIEPDRAHPRYIRTAPCGYVFQVR